MKKNVFGFLVDIKKLVVIAILIGLAIAIRSFATLSIGDTIKLDFGAVPIIMVIGILFGPIAGAIAGFSVDFIQFLIAPQFGPYNFIIALAFVIYGALPGLLFFIKSEKINIGATIITVFVTYIIGFTVITVGMVILGSTQGTFLTLFWTKMITRLPSLLHAIWYVVLTPVLAITGNKILSTWEHK